MTLAPEHELVAKITTPEQKAAVEAYVERTAKRSERERMADVKTISGVFREHMLNILYQRASSGLIGDYVLAYGTGAVMAVPGDERDYAFANFFKGQSGMPEIKKYFSNVDISKEAYGSKDNVIIATQISNGLTTKKLQERLKN
jgi:leucyl-tRNA synthetase